jgi:hypothetical protein
VTNSIQNKAVLTDYLIPLEGSQCTLNELEVIELLSKVDGEVTFDTELLWMLIFHLHLKFALKCYKHGLEDI